MRNLSLNSIKHLAHQLLIDLDTVDALILAKEEVLRQLVQSPRLVVQDALLHRLQVAGVARVHLVRFDVLGSLLSRFLAPISTEENKSLRLI